MIPIAQPLASGKTEEEIIGLIEKEAKKRTITTGIKGCQKKVLSGCKGLLVLTADTTPMDLITHLPALCEDRGIGYVFLRSKSIIPNRFTCVFLEDNKDIQGILETLG